MCYPLHQREGSLRGSSGAGEHRPQGGLELELELALGQAGRGARGAVGSQTTLTRGIFSMRMMTHSMEEVSETDSSDGSTLGWKSNRVISIVGLFCTAFMSCLDCCRPEYLSVPTARRSPCPCHRYHHPVPTHSQQDWAIMKLLSDDCCSTCIASASSR